MTPFRITALPSYGGANFDFSQNRTGVTVSVVPTGFDGFTNPVDPRPDELRQWAYNPETVPLEGMPKEWDLLIATNDLVGTLFDLARDPACPARRFALHCLYIYAAGGIRTNFREQPRRKLRKLIEQAEHDEDEALQTWAHNTKRLQEQRGLFDYHDWYEGGLVRDPRRL